MLVKVQFRKEISLQVFISRKIYTENELLWNYKMCGMTRFWVFGRDCRIIEHWFIHQLLQPVRHYWSHAWVKNLLPLCGTIASASGYPRDWEMRSIGQCCCGCHHHHFSPRKPQSEQWTLLQRNMIFHNHVYQQRWSKRDRKMASASLESKSYTDAPKFL